MLCKDDLHCYPFTKLWFVQILRSHTQISTENFTGGIKTQASNLRINFFSVHWTTPLSIMCIKLDNSFKRYFVLRTHIRDMLKKIVNVALFFQQYGDIKVMHESLYWQDFTATHRQPNPLLCSVLHTYRCCYTGLQIHESRGTKEDFALFLHHFAFTNSNIFKENDIFHVISHI